MQTRYFAAALTVILLPALAVLVPQSANAAPQSSVKIYLSPKIDAAGRIPESAGDAAAVGSAHLQPADRTRVMKIYHRDAGSKGPWLGVKTARPDGGGFVYFSAWGSQEYLAVVVAQGKKPQVSSPATRYPWKTVFSDEFTKGTRNPAWQPRGTTYVKNSVGKLDGMTRARSDNRACTGTANTLRLRTIRDPQNPGRYLNCHLGTANRFTFTTGWAAARVKFQRYPGAHAAFWLQSADGYSPNAAEVDIAEQMGSFSTSPKGTSLAQNVYYDWTNNRRYDLQASKHTVNDVSLFGAASGQRWWNSYHVYSVRWTSTQYQFWIDGHKVRTITAGISKKPEFLVLSMITRDRELGNLAKTNLGTQQVDVDWVRVWK